MANKKKSSDAENLSLDEMIDIVTTEKTTLTFYDNMGTPIAALVPYEAVQMLEKVIAENKRQGAPIQSKNSDEEIVGKLPFNILKELMR
jgi:hypothetical protein